jgi:hypothetical protein
VIGELLVEKHALDFFSDNTDRPRRDLAKGS